MACRDDSLFGTGGRDCFPDTVMQECAGDADCTGGAVCQLVRGPDGGVPGVTCAPAHAGGNKPGEDCNYTTGSPSCENGQCGRDSVCVQYCGKDGGAPCRAGYVCDFAPVDLEDGTTKYLRACIEARGSRTPCVVDADCSGGEVCRPWAYPDGAETHFGCQAPRAGGAAAGSVCGTQSPDHNGWCYNDLCGSDGRCTTHCGTPADCPDGGSCGPVEAKIVTGDSIFFQGCKTVDNKGDLGAPCPNGYLDCKADLFCADIGYDADGGTIAICTIYCGGDTGVDCSAPDAGTGPFECKNINGNDLCVPAEKD